MVNILFSGIDKKIGFSKSQADCLKEEIESNFNIIFIASIFDDYERNNEQFNRYINFFNAINITFKNSEIIDNRTDIEDAQELVKNADIIFLMGGSPELQMKSIIKYDLIKYFDNNKLYIGLSAGSMNQSKRVVYKDEFKNYEIQDYKGLNLINVNIFPHFDVNDINLLKESFEICNKIPLILLPNESFIRIKNNIVEYFGDYYLLRKQ
jgi:peptidase E